MRKCENTSLSYCYKNFRVFKLKNRNFMEQKIQIRKFHASIFWSKTVKIYCNCTGVILLALTNDL